MPDSIKIVCLVIILGTLFLIGWHQERLAAWGFAAAPVGPGISVPMAPSIVQVADQLPIEEAPEADPDQEDPELAPKNWSLGATGDFAQP